MRGSEHPVTRGDQVHAVGAILGLLWVLGILVSVDPFFHKKNYYFMTVGIMTDTSHARLYSFLLL